MAIGKICNREAVIVSYETTTSAAARLMRQHHVGEVIVMVENEQVSKPHGIVTDRDVVVEVVATGLDPEVITVGDIMANCLATLQEDTGVLEAIRCMGDNGVRRMPVVAHDGALLGILTLDDLLSLLAKEMGTLPALLERQMVKEVQTRR